MAVQAAAGALSLACPCDNIVMCAVPAGAVGTSQVHTPSCILHPSSFLSEPVYDVLLARADTLIVRQRVC